MSHEFSAGAGGESSAPESGAGPPRDDHPTPEELLAFHFGALETVDRDRVEDHLSRCPECAQLVLDFAAFPELEPVEETTPELERRLEEHRRGLIRQLREGGPEPGGGSEERPPPSRQPSERTLGEVVPGPWRRHLRIAWGVAAVFFVATVGLSLWIAEQAPRVGAIQPTVASVSTQRGLEDVRKIPVEERLFLVMRLNPADQDYPEYRLDLLDASGARTYSKAGLQLGNQGWLGFVAPRRWQAPGRYTVEIYGLDGNEAVYLGSLPVEFVRETQGEAEIR
jgi:hypothetical protein